MYMYTINDFGSSPFMEYLFLEQKSPKTKKKNEINIIRH